MTTRTACLVLAVAIGGVYYNTLGHGFVFDDYLVVVNHPTITRIASDLTQAFSLSKLGYRPIRVFSYVLDYRFGGMQPWIFHLSNLIYHWITACLVFFVTLKLLRSQSDDGEPAARDTSADTRRQPLGAHGWIALSVALLWALHPIQTEAVAYISGRRDILSTLFFFLGFYAFLKLREQSQAAQADLVGRIGWVVLICLAYILGLLSKEMAVTLPLVMLCYDYVQEVRVAGMPYGWRYGRELGHCLRRTVWTYKWLYPPFLLGGLFFSWYAAFVRLPAWHVDWYGGSVVTNFLTTARIWVHYLWLLCFPKHLLADYTGAFPITRSPFDLSAWLAVGLLGVLFLVLLGVLRLSRLVPFGGMWTAVTLLPVSHIIPYPEMMAEHYLYLPSFGLCLLLGLGLARFTNGLGSRVTRHASSSDSSFDARRATRGARPWRVVVGYGVLVVILALYAARTVSRSRDWRDNLTFYTRLVADNPHSARARLGLGYIYDRSGLPRMAITHYQAGLRLSPQDPRLHTNLGAAYQKLGMLAEAEQTYQTALKLRPRDTTTLNNLGFLYTEKREYEKAQAVLEQAEHLSGGKDAAVLANLGLLHEMQGQLVQALAAYRRAEQVAPANVVYAQKIAALEEQLAQRDLGADTREHEYPISP